MLECHVVHAFQQRLTPITCTTSEQDFAEDYAKQWLEIHISQFETILQSVLLKLG